MKRVCSAEEGDPGATRRRSADVAIGKIVAALDCTKKRARSAAQHWMHTNWFTGLELRKVIEDRWAEHSDKSVEVQPLVFRMREVGEMFKSLPAEEQAEWEESAREEASEMRKEIETDDGRINPVDVASYVP